MRNNFFGVFFIALFGALLAVFWYAASADWSIHEWNGVISWATAENLDVDRRISSFYKAFGIFFIVFFSIVFLINRVGKRIFEENELSTLNYLSLAGCMLLFFKLIGSEVHESLMLIFILQLLVVLYAFADSLSGRKRKQSFSIHELAWCVAMGVSACFLLQGFIDISTYYNKCLLILSAVALCFCFWSERKAYSIQFCEWIISLRFAALIPLWVVVSQELFMIFNQRNIFSIPPVLIFVLLLILTALLVARSRKKVRSLDELERNALRSISNFYFPWLLIGLIAFTYYRPVVETSTEMFEQANPALSIQQYFEFGKLPWLQTFSSHSGADFATGFLYSFLNGFSGLSYHCYDFLIVVLYVLLMYYTLKNLTGNAYLAILSLLIFPYVNLLLPQFHFVMLLPLLVFAATLNAPTLRNYFLLFSCLILMPLWRYDLAYGNILSLGGCLVLFLFLKKDLRLSVPALRKGFLFALIIPAVLFIGALFLSHQSLLITMKDAVAYLGTPQAFGTKDLANEKNLIYFVLYFIFPCAVTACLFFTLWRLWSRRDEKHSFLHIAVVFLSIYYIANFHRGLIRHNLAEGWDTAFTSFAFLIFTATVYDFLRTKNKTLQLAATCAFGTLLLAQFKYPQPDLTKSNYYSELYAAIHHPNIPDAKEKIDRAPVNVDFAKETFADLKEFLDENIPADATFLDFSNTPMLYFYTHRRSPNYFNQIPHTALNFYLQQRFLEELKNYDIPVVLFSNEPAQWWDSFDGIPNSYRHYLIAEHIYGHYQPYAIINKHAVWIKKGNGLLEDTSLAYPRDTASVQAKEQELKFLPYVMGKSFPLVLNDSLVVFKVIISDPYTIDEATPDKYVLTEPVRNDEANHILLKAKNLSRKRSTVRLSYGNNDLVNGGFTFFLKEDDKEHLYLIRLSTQYNWYNRDNNNFRFTADGKCELKEIYLVKGKL